jgi:hypothetical protein
MSSVTATVVNNTGFAVTAIVTESPSHGLKPNILNPTIPARGTQSSVFVANSDGAGVEGSVSLTRDGGAPFKLIYDNPVVGDNSGSVTAPSDYKGSCQAGGGTNATFTYTIGPV